MLNGTVLFAGCSRSCELSVGQILTVRHPRVRAEYARDGAQALLMQGLLRPEVVVMGMEQPDMTGEHLICEVRRDIARPFIVVCTGRLSEQEQGRIRRMGANAVMRDPVDIAKTEELIERQLEKRLKAKGMAGMSLQRIFAEAGVPFDLKGYRYLEYALTLLDGGDMQLEPVSALYERIGERYGCLPAAVERNIRYAIRQCAERNERMNGMGNRQFISKLVAEKEAGAAGICSPRVSVFCSGRRVFR